MPALEHLQRCAVCDPGEIFFTSKFSYVLFCNPTNKTETGTANRWEQTTWTNHHDEPIRNTEKQLDHIYYTLLCKCTPLLLCLLRPRQLVKIMLSQNHFLPESNWHMFDFVHRILLCRITYWAPLEMLLGEGNGQALANNSISKT